MMRVATIFMFLLVTSCGSYDSAMEVIEGTKKLEEENRRLQAQVRNLNERLNNALEEAQSNKEEAEKLRAEKEVLENMGEERIKKFFLMYKSDGLQ